MEFQLFEVGGCVRDDLLGVDSKDVDFSVVGPQSFAEMRDELVRRGFKVFVESEETVTVRAKVPASMPELQARTDVADFVLARKESTESDGRRPEVVEVGTLEDDLRRRDFTVNALARAMDDSLVDLFGGLDDLANMTLRFVGVPMDRLREDALRVLRGFRFLVTKGFTAAPETWEALTSPEAAELLSAVRSDGSRVVSVERMREEVNKMMLADTPATLELLVSLPEATRKAMFPEGLRLSATMKK